DDVGAGAEDLGELDEGRPERGDRRGQSLRPLTVGLGASSEGAAEDDPAPAVPQERDDERCQAPDDDESPAPAFHSRSAEARPRRRKKPARSVRVVTKIDDATAGSTPRRSSRIGTKAPAKDATIMFPHMARRTTRPSRGSLVQVSGKSIPRRT